jgi:amidase
VSAATPAGASAIELAALIRDREVSAAEAVESALERIELHDGPIGAFLTVGAEAARLEAAAADRALRDGVVPGPLHGVPVAVKDLECTRGLRTTYGSRAFESFVPDEDAISVERLRAAGAIVIGKTNTPEFGLLGETRNVLAPETRNPWDRERTVGGSSGGSAAAVAAGMVAIATGNDTAGSITCPSAMCGVVGVKPTHGRIPNWPDPGDSRLFLDSGPITRTVADAALMLRVMGGADPRDPVSSWDGVVSSVDPRAERRIAWSPDWGRLAVDEEVRAATEAAVREFEALGYVVETAHPELGDPMDILLTLLAADAEVMLEVLGLDRGDLGPESRAELELLGVPSVTAYIRALNELWRFRAGMDRFFERHALMITPSTAVPAFPIGEPPARIAGRDVEQRWTTFMPFQAPWNVTGQPTASVPCGRTAAGLPVGLQITAARGCDEALVGALAAFEAARPWSYPTLPHTEAR